MVKDDEVCGRIHNTNGRITITETFLLHMKESSIIYVLRYIEMCVFVIKIFYIGFWAKNMHKGSCHCLFFDFYPLVSTCVRTII